MPTEPLAHIETLDLDTLRALAEVAKVADELGVALGIPFDSAVVAIIRLGREAYESRTADV